MALGGGKTFNLAPIQQRQPQGVPQTGMAQGNFDPLLDLESGLQNVDGLTQDYYDLWAGLNSVLKEQQSLGIDPFDATTPEGQQLGRTIMKTVGAMKMIGDQLKTGQSIQQAMIPYIATGQAKLAEGEDLSQGITSVQGLQNQFVPQRVDPTVQEANQYYARAFEDTNDMNAANRKLSSERVRWQGIADDPNTSQANREYAQRQVQAIGMASQNIHYDNPWQNWTQGGIMNPQQIGAIKKQWWNIISGKDFQQLYENNEDIIRGTADINPDLGILTYDELKNGKKIRRFIDISKENNYGLSTIKGVIDAGIPTADRITTSTLIKNNLDPANTFFTKRDITGENDDTRIEPANAEMQKIANATIDDAVAKTMEYRFKSDNPYASQIEKATGLAVPPGYAHLGLGSGEIIDNISTTWTVKGTGKLLIKPKSGKEVEIRLDNPDVKEFLRDFYKYNYNYIGFPRTLNTGTTPTTQPTTPTDSTSVTPSVGALDNLY